MNCSINGYKEDKEEFQLSCKINNWKSNACLSFVEVRKYSQRTKRRLYI